MINYAIFDQLTESLSMKVQISNATENLTTSQVKWHDDGG